MDSVHNNKSTKRSYLSVARKTRSTDMDQVTQALNNNNIKENPSDVSFRRIRIVKNVHEDDIHNIVPLADDTFITGSKDGCLKKWDRSGKLLQVVENAKKIDYKKWCTALAPLNQTQWVSGSRDGSVKLWDNEGKLVRTLKTRHAKFPNKFPICKQRNVHRVNCLTSFEKETGKSFFFAGWATQFTLHNSKEGKRLQYQYTSSNDWVYCLNPLSKSRMLVVTGCQLDLWKCQESHPYTWSHASNIITEGKKSRPRPFISAVTSLQGRPEHFNIAVFDGSVRVVDLAKEKIVFQGKEHKNRVWTVPSVFDNCFASCADDGLIKLWDVRKKPKSVATAKDNEHEKARVSVLLALPNSQLLSGSCPDNVKKSKDKAQFSFWDLRKV